MESRALVVLLLVACSAPQSHPANPNAEHISIVDGVVFRQERDNSVSVLVSVSLDAVSATGSVRLRGVDLAAAPASKHLRYARARAWQVLAEKASAPEVAFDAAVRGVAEIDGTYAIKGLNDDSSRTLRMLQRQREASSENMHELSVRAREILARKLQHYGTAWDRELL